MIKIVRALKFHKACKTYVPNSKEPTPFYSEPLPSEGQSFKGLSVRIYTIATRGLFASWVLVKNES